MICEAINELKINQLNWVVAAHFPSTNTRENQSLVRIQFSLIFSLVLNEIGIVFSVVGVLLFMNWMGTAPVFFIAMGMVDLCPASINRASAQLRKSVGGSDIYIQGIEAMPDGLACLRYVDTKAFDIVRRANEQFKIFAHIMLDRSTDIVVDTLLDLSQIKCFAWLIAADLGINNQ